MGGLLDDSFEATDAALLVLAALLRDEVLLGPRRRPEEVVDDSDTETEAVAVEASSCLERLRKEPSERIPSFATRIECSYQNQKPSPLSSHKTSLMQHSQELESRLSPCTTKTDQISTQTALYRQATYWLLPRTDIVPDKAVAHRRIGGEFSKGR